MGGDNVGLFEHFGVLSSYLFILFVCIVFQDVIVRYNHFVDNVDLVIEAKNETIKKEAIRAIENEIQKIFNSRKINMIFLIIFLSGVILNAVTTSKPYYFYNNDFFDSAKHIAGYITWRFFWIFFFGFILSQLVAVILKMILSIKMIINIIEDKGIFRLIPIFPDGAGGLGNLGKFALILDFSIAPLPFVVILFFYTQGETLTNFILFFISISFMCFLFFVPLWPAHRIMRDTKRRELERLGREYKKYYYKLLYIHKNRKEKVSSYKINFGKIEEIEFFYIRTEKLPVWPFDTFTLTRFTGTVIFPILLLIIEMLLGA